MDKVFFPKYQNKIEYSHELMDFFKLNAIKIEDQYFDMELLRRLSKSNIKLFYRLKLELELKGFNFEPTNRFFESNVDYENYEYLYTEDESSFSPFELQKLGLWEVISNLNIYKKKFYNYAPLERFVAYAKYQSNFKELMNNSNFQIIKYEPILEVIEEAPEENDEYSKIEEIHISDIFISKIILQTLSMFRKVSPELRMFLVNNGIKTVEDLVLKIPQDLNKFLLKYNNQNDYTLNVLTRTLKDFYFYLLKVKEKYNFDNYMLIKYLTDYNFMRQSNELEDFNHEFIYFDELTLKKYDTEFINIIGMYDVETNLLKKLNLVNLTRLFNVNHYTNLQYYCSDKYQFEDFYYDFYFLLEKIYSELYEKYHQDPIYEEKNLKALYQLPNMVEYLDSLKLGYNENTINIVSYRDKGITLQEVGSKFNVTRERIRQIQKKFVRDNENYIKNLTKNIILKFNFLPIEILYSYPGMVRAIADLNMLEFDTNAGVFLHRNLLTLINNSLNEWNPTNGLEEIVEEILEKSKIDLSYFITKIGKDKIAIPNKSLREIGEEYLLTKGSTGWVINEDTEEIINFYSKYNKEIKGKRNIIAYITDNENAILYNIGKYIHRDNVEEKHINAMKNVIENVSFNEYGNNAKDIFDENKSYLIENGISNYYYLYGLTKEFYKAQKLVFTGRSMRIGLEETLNPTQNIIVAYLKEHNNIASIKTLKSKLSIDDITIQQTRSIYKLDANTIVTDDFFSIEESEEESLLNTIDKYISLQGYCHTQNIIDDLYFNTEINSFFKRNRIGKDQNRLVYYLYYYFNELYSFSVRNKVVIPLGIEVKSYGDLIQIHFKDRTFSMEELKERFDYFDMRSSITQSKIINDNIIKLDRNKYIFKNDFDIEYINLSALDDIMSKYFSNKTIVFSKEIIRRLKEHDLLEELWNKEELLATLITQSELPWQKVTINVFTNAFSNSGVMLYNNQGKNRDISINELLINFIYEKNKGYLTIDDINQILLDYEITTSKVPNNILYDIFSEYNAGGLIRVIKNET